MGVESSYLAGEDHKVQGVLHEIDVICVLDGELV